MTPFSESALEMLGQILEGRGLTYRLVVVGGAALQLRGVTSRSTTDVDVMALINPANPGQLVAPPDPLPAELGDAATRVSSELGLTPDWLNAKVAQHGVTHTMPKGMVDRLEWRQYRTLYVGIAGRFDLISLKLHAAVDTDATTKHYQDLLKLQPSDAELQGAAEWVLEQDAGDGFAALVDEVCNHVRRDR